MPDAYVEFWVTEVATYNFNYLKEEDRISNHKEEGGCQIG